MKRLFLLLATFGLLATACESNQAGDQNGNGGGSSPKIELSKTKRCVASTSGEYAIMVTSPYQWEAVSKNNNWIIVESASGIAGSEELRFRVEANESNEVRKGTILVYNTSSNIIAELSVVQAAKGQSLEDLEEEENKNDNNSGNGGGSGSNGGNGSGNSGGSGNNGGGSGSGAGEKKLVKMVYTDGDYSDARIFSYDNQGRLVQCVYESTSEGQTTLVCTYSYEWRLDTIIGHYEYEYTYTMMDELCTEKISSTYTHALNNHGLVKSSEELEIRTSSHSPEPYKSESQYVYVYNASKRPIEVECRWKSQGGTNSSYEWDADKLLLGNYSSIASPDTSNSTFTYDGTLCRKGYNPEIAVEIRLCADEALTLAHPELFGVRTMHLPATITYIMSYTDDTPKYSYSYKMDNEGYITKITCTDNNGYSYSYILTWE